LRKQKNWSYRHSFTYQTVDLNSKKRSELTIHPSKRWKVETQTLHRRTKSRNGQPKKAGKMTTKGKKQQVVFEKELPAESRRM